ncbi:hypothetical protein T12_1432 [Trichinella patagoniensis]|uniref:Uncharacterized protein n=1 Tax=Trichinella patagoniensis TaxID=990121 RepID=A0A0V1AEB2_9BILA|nr:hypothetical protein T12_1432 [Trichinella patagoniensis]
MLEDVKNRISEKSLTPGRNYAMLENRSTPTEGDFKGCATWLCIPARSGNNKEQQVPSIHVAVVVTTKQPRILRLAEGADLRRRNTAHRTPPDGKRILLY